MKKRKREGSIFCGQKSRQKTAVFFVALSSPPFSFFLFSYRRRREQARHAQRDQRQPDDEEDRRGLRPRRSPLPVRELLLREAGVFFFFWL